jgi:DNA-binding XRE family transcriptional regulator
MQACGMSGKLDKVDLELKKKIAMRLTELRKTSGQSQTEFAYDFEIDKQSLNSLEKGRRGASIYTINKICKFRGITLNQFFDSPLFKETKK